MAAPRTTTVSPSSFVRFGALVAVFSAVACGGADETLHPDWVDDAESLSQRRADSAGDESDQAEPLALAEPGDPAVQAQLDEQVALALQEARSQWAEQGANDYSVKVRRVCFCAPRVQDHVQVTVVDGEVASALGQSDSGQYDQAIALPSMEDWYTVSGMFGRIEANLGSADRINVVFDAEHGFPTELAFDYRLVSAEEGEYFEMWDFLPTPVE
jgi:hypothetical protein